MSMELSTYNRLTKVVTILLIKIIISTKLDDDL